MFITPLRIACIAIAAFLSIYISHSSPQQLKMTPKPKMNVHSFPRPPLLEKISRHLVIKWGGTPVIDTKESYWALETTHPPSMLAVVCPDCFANMTISCSVYGNTTKHILIPSQHTTYHDPPSPPPLH
jgi:hypothetical protein